MNLKIIFIISLAILCKTNYTYAGHTVGADITYETIGNGQYRVKYKLYRDCQGLAAPTNPPLLINSVSCNSTSQILMNQISGTGNEITHGCSISTCSGGTSPGIQEYEYEATVTLPFQCSDWIFSVSEPGRNGAITTFESPDTSALYVEAVLNNVQGEHSSPFFSGIPVVLLCVGTSNIINSRGIDADGNTLIYSFIPPRSNYNTSLVYKSGYSVNQPVVASSPTMISQDGELSISPTQPDVTIIAVLVQEFRNGIFIGSVMRDMQIYVANCNNTLPNLSGMNGSTAFRDTVPEGTQICFDIISSDADVNDTLRMLWDQGIAGATFTPTGVPIQTGHFCWTPPIGSASSTPYYISVIVRDNACPSNGVQFYTYVIDVTSTTSIYSITGSEEKIRILPNPNSGSFILELPDEVFNAGGVLELYDNLAQLIYSEKILDGNGGNKSLDVRLNKGVYTLRLNDGENVFINRVIIQ